MKLFSIGETHLKLGHYSVALKFANQALKMNKQLHHKLSDKHIAYNLSTLGFIYSGLNNHKKALQCHKDAYDLVLKGEKKLQHLLLDYQQNVIDCEKKSQDS